LSITNAEYAQILQSVDFTNLDTIYFDAYLWSEGSGLFEASVLVGATPVWTQACTTTATEYLHVSIDVSGYSGSQDLIFRITCTKNPSTAKDSTNYFDNITVWESYDDGSQTNVWGTTANPYDTGTQTAYIYGAAFANSTQYKVAYYDGADDLQGQDTPTSGGTGALSSAFSLRRQNAAAGTWHAVVYGSAETPPSTYTPADVNIIEDDDFLINQGAIPEFPTVIAGIVVAGLCFGSYYWMRRRRLAGVKA
ncbi:hypothetical protein ACFLUE_02145, partial [Chloroflexota bacterium]